MTALEKSYWEHVDRKVGDWTFQKRQKIKQLILDTVRELFTEHQVKTVLDLGCGIGIYFPLYSELGLRVHAVDYSEVRLEYAKKVIESQNLRGITLCCEDFFSIEDFGFHDCIMLSYVLEHLELSKVKLLIDRIRNHARYFIVAEYYSEPFAILEAKHRLVCQRQGVPFNTHNASKGVASAVYDYPKLFNMPYSLYQIDEDCSILVFENVNL